MSVERFGGKTAFVLFSAVLMSACSPQASTAVPPVSAAGAMSPVMAAAPPATQLVQGLPDFTALVERYGPAVVNVQVAERPSATQGRNDPRGIDPNDPF